jgi:hypothetical protein
MDCYSAASAIGWFEIEHCAGSNTLLMPPTLIFLPVRDSYQVLRWVESFGVRESNITRNDIGDTSIGLYCFIMETLLLNIEWDSDPFQYNAGLMNRLD